MNFVIPFLQGNNSLVMSESEPDRCFDVQVIAFVVAYSQCLQGFEWCYNIM